MICSKLIIKVPKQLLEKHRWSQLSNEHTGWPAFISPLLSPPYYSVAVISRVFLLATQGPATVSTRDFKYCKSVMDESGGHRGRERVPRLTLCLLCLRRRDLMPSTLEGQITMEKTPSYFVTNHAPKRIHSMARDIKLIIVVRNPVTRAISDYTQTLSKRPEIPTFEVLAFKNRTLGLIDASWSALRIGIYALHLESWMQYFPLSQMHFVSGERLIVDPAGEMAKVQDFLGLKRIVTDKHFYFNKTKGFPCLKKPEDSSTPRCLGKSKGRTHPQIEPQVIQRLHKFYKPFNMMFYQMTGQNFEWELEEDRESRSSQD